MALICAALVGPSLVDWNGYRTLLAGQLSSFLGRPVMISGDVDAALLPRPVFKAEGIQIGDLKGGDSITVDILDARLAFMPLLSGRMQVRELILLRPDVRVTDAQLSFFDSLEFNQSDELSVGERRGDSDSPNFSLAVDSVQIEDGTIEVQSTPDETHWRAIGINAVVALTERGGFAVDSTLSLQNTPLMVQAAWTPINSGSAYGVNIAIDLVEAGIQARFIGSANRSPSGGFRGDVSVTGESGRAALATLGLIGSETKLPGNLLSPFSIAAKVHETDGVTSTDTLSIDVGGTHASGGATWTGGAVPNLDLNLEFAPVDVKSWQFAELSSPGGSRLPPYEFGKNVLGRAYAAEESVSNFDIPTELTASVQLRAPVLSYGNDVLRNGVLDATLVDGEITLQKFGVSLPGATTLRAFGFVRNNGFEPVFDGAVELDTQNLRGALTWLGAGEKVDQVPRGRLSNASFRAATQGTPNRFSLTELNASVDTSRVSGTAYMSWGERTSIGLDISIDSVNLDTYLPMLTSEGLSTLFLNVGSPEDSSPNVYGVTPVLTSLRSLALVDADVRVTVESLTAGSVPDGSVGLDLNLKDGVLNILSASFDNVAGATLWFSGGIEGFGTTPQFRDFQIDLHAHDLGRLARAYGFNAPRPLRGLAPVTLNGLINGGLSQIDFVTTAELDELIVSANGRGISLDQNPNIEFTLNVRHPSHAALMNDLELRWPASERDPGAISFATRVSQSGTGTRVEDLELSVGSQSLRGRISINEAPGQKEISGRIENISVISDVLWPIDPAQQFLSSSNANNSPTKSGAQSERWSDEPLDWSALKDWKGELVLSGSRLRLIGIDLRDFDALVTLNEGVAEISQWDGYLFGAKGRLALRASLDPDPTLSGEVDFVGGDLASFAGAVNEGQSTGLEPGDGEVDFDGEFEMTGISPRDLVQNLSGRARLKLTTTTTGSGTVAGLLGAISAVNQMENLATGGSARPVVIDALLSGENGLIKIEEGAMKSRSYGGAFSGTVDLPNWHIDMTANLSLENLPRADAATQRTLPTSVPITVRGRLDLPNIILNPS